MPLDIDDPETAHLAKELAALTGEPLLCKGNDFAL